MLTLLTLTALAGDASVQLPDAPGLHDRWDAARAWGTPLLVETLVTSMERIAWDHPEWDPMIVGDLSTRGGGPMFGHKTHDRGIDADLSLFIRGGRTLSGFEDLTPSMIDAAATWTVIETLLDSGNVQFILLDQGHIDRLARYLERDLHWSRADIAAVLLPRDSRVPWSARGVVRHAPNHASHLHVRVTPNPPPRPTN